MSTNGAAPPTNGQRTQVDLEDGLEDVLEALRQAGKQAHLEAYLTGTGVVVHRDGAIRVIAPDPAMYEDLIPPLYVEEPLPAAS